MNSGRAAGNDRNRDTLPFLQSVHVTLHPSANMFRVEHYMFDMLACAGHIVIKKIK